MIKKIKSLQKSSVSNEVNKRLKEFKNNKNWFSELCFCLLTANWKAKESIDIQKEVGKGFNLWSKTKLANFLKKKGHRFWPQRAERIVLARKYLDIKKIISKEDEPREWLVKNIKGLGYKESSHFLRNVGYNNYAILDRHIISLMAENKLIQVPKTLTKRRYLDIEEKFVDLAKELNMNCAELDLYMFYIKTNQILK